MSVLYVADSAVDRATWLQARQGGVGASDVGKIMTSGTAGWAALHKKKRDGDTFTGNAYTRHGNAREPYIAAFVRDEYGLIPSSTLLAREDNPTHMATPDAVSEDMRTLGEYKTTSRRWTNLEPSLESFASYDQEAYWWQMQWQMYVTGATRVVFAWEEHQDFVPLDFEPRVIVVERDDEHIAQALEKVAEWEAMRDQADEELPDALVPLDDLTRELLQLREERDRWEVLVKAKETEIRQLLEEHGKEVNKDFTVARVSWSFPKPRRTFNSSAFKEADPATYEKYMTESASTPRLMIQPRSKK